MFLPDLLYCDRNRVVNQLSMLVDDLLTQYSVKQQKTKEQGGEVGGELSSSMGGIIAKYKGENSKTVEREGIVKSTSAALFRDLHSILKEEGEVQELVGYDDEILEKLNPGEIIELTGKFTLSPIEVIFSTFEETLESYGWMDSLKEEADSNGMQVFKTMLSSSDKASFLVEPLNEDVACTFITDLKQADENLFSDNIQDISGTLTVLGRIKRFVPQSEEVDIIQKYLPGDFGFNRDSILELIETMPLDQLEGIRFRTIDKLDMDSFLLEGPAYEIKPTAIYREEKEI